MKRLLTLGKVSRPTMSHLPNQLTRLTTSHLPNQLTRLTKTQLSRPFSVQPLRRPNGFVQRLNQIDPTKVIWTLIGTNGAIFLTWTYAKSTYEQFGDPKLLKFMYKHFTSSELAIDQGRLYTLLTSTFSHQDLSHFGINMFVLYSMGLGVLEAIGTSRFLLLYTGAGLFASLTTLAYKRYLVPLLEENKYGRYQERKVSSLGASGSIMGLTSFFACACKFFPLSLLSSSSSTPPIKKTSKIFISFSFLFLKKKFPEQPFLSFLLYPYQLMPV